MGKKIKILDYIIIAISMISVIGLVFYFLNISTPPSEYGAKNYDPFYDYYTNKGIITIFSVRIILWTALLFIGIRWIYLKKIKKHRLTFFIILLLFVAIIQWIELWYGSTFYYCEVRDKQGLGIPILSMFLVSYIILRLDIQKIQAKIGLVSLNVLFQYLIYYLVHENWILYPDLYIPGTNLPLF